MTNLYDHELYDQRYDHAEEHINNLHWVRADQMRPRPKFPLVSKFQFKIGYTELETKYLWNGRLRCVRCCRDVTHPICRLLLDSIRRLFDPKFVRCISWLEKSTLHFGSSLVRSFSINAPNVKCKSKFWSPLHHYSPHYDSYNV